MNIGVKGKTMQNIGIKAPPKKENQVCEGTDEEGKEEAAVAALASKDRGKSAKKTSKGGY